MNRSSVKRGRRGRPLLIALGALAVLALPGVAVTQGHGLGHGRGHDHENAGTIQSFDPVTGKLTIALTDGETVSGVVVDRTRVHCGDHPPKRRGKGPGPASRPGEQGEQGGPGPRGGEQGDNGSSEGPPPGQDGTPPGSSEDPGEGAERSERCSSEDLTVGAPVDVAELVLIDGKAIYKMVALDKEVESDDD